MPERIEGELGRYVVVDVETTGLYNSDRVVEVAAVTLTTEGRIIDEWDTLVDPQRDIGTSHIHGITASMVSAAPGFEEISVPLASRIHGAVLIAHNLAFDSRMLANEYTRLGACLDAGSGACTLSICGERLTDACARHGIAIERQHRALADARASAQLFRKLGLGKLGYRPAYVRGLSDSAFSRTLRRDVVRVDEASMPYLACLAIRSHHRGERGATLEYLDMLDWALADLAITAEEANGLAQVAAELGMSDEHVRQAHKRYFQELVAAACRDSRVTDDEYLILTSVSCLLGLDPRALEEAVVPWRQQEKVCEISPGMRVCFTGTATRADGSELARRTLYEIAVNMGLDVVDSVSKKGCDLLVAADSSSQSGKAQKARSSGIPVIDVRSFLSADVNTLVPRC